MRKNHVVLIGTAFIAAIAASLVCTSCEKLEFWKNEPRIGFNVTAQGTKAAAYTTDALKTTGQSFNMIAVADDDWVDNETNVTTDAGEYFKSVVKFNGSSWKTYDSTGSVETTWNWLNGVSIHFWSYYPTSLGTTGASRVITDPVPESDVLYFSYSQPTPVTPVAPSTTYPDASNQIDIIFAGNEETRVFDEKTGEITDVASSYSEESTPLASTPDDSYFNIRFHHALSEIRFAVSTDDGLFDPSLTITKVSIVNSAGSGDCAFTLPSSFVWSNLSSRTTYSQSYGTLPTATNSEWEVGTYTNSSSVTKNLYTNLNSFFLIPESDLSSLSAEITFKTGTGDYIIRNASLDLFTDSTKNKWEAGKYYTYKINLTNYSISLGMSLSLLDWGYMETEYDYTKGPTCTMTEGKLKLTNETPVGSKTAVADTPIEASFTLDTPIGATWFVSVTNTDAFEVYTSDGTDSEGPASGIIQNGPLGTAAANKFYIKAKPGIDRSTVLSTSIHITVRLADGTYVNVDDILGVSDWNIILNPLS